MTPTVANKPSTAITDVDIIVDRHIAERVNNVVVLFMDDPFMEIIVLNFKKRVFFF